MIKLKRIKEVDKPQRSSDGLLCYDLAIPKDTYKILYPHTYTEIPLGVVLLNKGDTNVYGELTLRFSVAKRGLLIPNGVGFIRANNTKEISVLVYNASSFPKHLNSGDRICQIVIHGTDEKSIVIE